MIPKVSSLPSLNQAASARGVGRANSQAGGRDNTSGSRRRSIDSNSRSRSRHGSNVDLVALELDATSGASAAIAIPRVATPPPLWVSTANLALEPLLESPATFSAADALTHMSKLSAALAQSRSIDEPWAGLAASPSAYALPVAPSPAISPEPDCVASLDISKEPVKSSLAPELVKVALAPAVVTAPEPAAPARTKSGKKRVGPAARPGPDELRIYRTTMKMDYVQELLGNIAHVQHMVRGVAAAPSTTGAAAAIAAAKLLARSLSRSALRIKESVKDANTVHLSEDALVTLAEFGWVEVSTEDPEQAKMIGCVEAELHHIPTGRVTAWQRPAVDKSWFKVGESLAMEPYYWDRAAAAAAAAAGVENPAAGQLGVASPAVAAVAAAARRGLMPLAGLADQLVAAGQSVMTAAAALQQWLEEQKVSLAAAVIGGNLAGLSPPTSTPSQPLNTVVGFCPPSLAVAAGI